MEEAPLNGKAFGRRMKEWIDAYPKPVLDAFVAQVLDAAKRCEDAWAAIQNALKDYVREAEANDKIYGRKNKAWVEVPTAGGGGGGAPRVSVVEAMEWTQLTTDADIVLFIPPGGDDTGYNNVTVELPNPTATCAINLLVGPTWNHQSNGKLNVEIRLRTSTEESAIEHQIYYSGGSGQEAKLGFKLDYMLVFHDGKWYVTDAMPAQPR